MNIKLKNIYHAYLFFLEGRTLCKYKTVTNNALTVYYVVCEEVVTDT